MIYQPIPLGKTCSKCGAWKALNAFYKHPQCKDGHIGVCKKCKERYYQENKSQKTLYQRTYWHQNKDKAALYIAKNKDRVRPNRRLYRKEYLRNHPEKNTVSKQRRKARKQQFPDTFTVSDWQRALNYFDGCCAVCGRQPGLWHTIAADHWISLTSPDCPGTVPTNIIPLCHGVDGCNNNKSNRNPIKWLSIKFGPRKAKTILKRIEDYFAWIQTCH